MTYKQMLNAITSKTELAEKHVKACETEMDTNAKIQSNTELKARLSLLEQEFLMEMAKVGDFGCRKYAEEDWRDNPNVMVKARVDSLQRHVAKFSSSSFSDLDDDTNLSHLAHVAFNAMMLWWLVKHRPERDNRYKGTK
jgi:hypothetical protein